MRKRIICAGVVLYRAYTIVNGSCGSRGAPDLRQKAWDVFQRLGALSMPVHGLSVGEMVRRWGGWRAAG